MARTADLPPSPSFAWDPLGSPWRWPLAAATVVAALAHVPVIAPHLHEAPYMGEEFIVLTAACLLLGLAAAVCDSAAVYGLTAVTCGLAIACYAATRLLAFPHLGDDVGNWFEPLGVVSIVAETVAFIAAVNGLLSRRPGTAPTRAGSAATGRRPRRLTPQPRPGRDPRPTPWRGAPAAHSPT